MDAITQAAGHGLSRLFDYGAAMTVLVLVLIAGAFLIRYLLNRCDQRSEASTQAFQHLQEKTAAVIDKNTEAFTRMSERLTVFLDREK